MSRSKPLSAVPAWGFALLALALHCGGGSNLAHAESKQFGAYEVHYNVVSTIFLQPQIAAAYGIVRSPQRALLNVALRRRAGTDSVPVAARITGEQGDLVRQSALRFREQREPQAIYYLAEFEFSDAQTVYFNVALHPEGDQATLKLQFNSTLYEE